MDVFFAMAGYLIAVQEKTFINKKAPGGALFMT